MIPYVIEQTAHGERSYDIYSRLLKSRIIMMQGEVEEQMATSIVSQLLFLDAEDSTKPIYLYINSPGGVVTAGMAIYDTMQYIRCDVSTICVGMAASKGAYLLAAGAKGKRFALPNSEIMIHQPLISGGLSGQTTDIKIYSDHLVRTKEHMNKILSERTGKSYEQVCEDTERDNFMSAQQALDYGIVDSVIESKKTNK